MKSPSYAALFCCLLTLLLPVAAASVTPEQVDRRFRESDPGHPRLYLRNFDGLWKNRSTPLGRQLTGRIVHEADLILTYPPAERVMSGRRLLEVSRNVLYRVHTLGMAYRLTGNSAYAERAVTEMINAAAFADWNPSHFLDVAEMTLALAFGYDWLYEVIPETERGLIAGAILEKGLRPSWPAAGSGPWWISAHNNWNQVCHAGLTAGALAVYEEAPHLAAATVARAVNHLPNAMRASYAPNGAYPEGPAYWGYGTDFNVALLAILESALGTDFGLAEQPGFRQTGDYMKAMRAPSGKYFNYADSSETVGLGIAPLWLTRRFDRPELFGPLEERAMRQEARRRNPDVTRGGNRMLPLAMIFLAPNPASAAEAKSTPLPTWYFSGGDAAVPVAAFRSDWSDQAVYLGVKAGSPSWNHGHMDVGGFVLEADGVRWASDLGMENYTRLEALKIGLWDRKQQGDRWHKIFRTGPFSHNILLIDRQFPVAAARAEIIECTEHSATVDLSPLYSGQAERVIRHFRLQKDRTVEITDELRGVKPGALLRWQMLTQGNRAAIAGENAVLHNGGRRLALSVETPLQGQWRIEETAALENAWDTPNPHARMLVYQQTAPPGGHLTYTVKFKPVAAEDD